MSRKHADCGVVVGDGRPSIAVHDEPVWRARANVIIRAWIPGRNHVEQLWARQLEGARFELCCIPFFLYDLSLGDEVQTDDGWVVSAVLRPLGRHVFRLYLESSPVSVQAIEETLSAAGCLFEWSSTSLLAIDAADDTKVTWLAGYLASLERLGGAEYETGRTRPSP